MGREQCWRATGWKPGRVCGGQQLCEVALNRLGVRQFRRTLRGITERQFRTTPFLGEVKPGRYEAIIRLVRSKFAMDVMYSPLSENEPVWSNGDISSLRLNCIWQAQFVPAIFLQNRIASTRKVLIRLEKRERLVFHENRNHAPGNIPKGGPALVPLPEIECCAVASGLAKSGSFCSNLLRQSLWQLRGACPIRSGAVLLATPHPSIFPT